MARATTPTRRPAAAAAAPAFSCWRARVSTGSVTSRMSSTLPSAGRSALPAAAVVVTRGRAATCACSPTTHAGSFRCAAHRRRAGAATTTTASAAAGLHGARRSAMANSLVRIAAVEGGDQVRRALAALIRPSSHDQRRRGAFRPRPSRLSAMSAATAVN